MGVLAGMNFETLRADGFSGPAWPDVESLPQALDLAIICTPAETVPDLIAALGRKGTRAAIVLSAGLKRASGAGGPTLEQAMLDWANSRDIGFSHFISLGDSADAAETLTHVKGWQGERLAVLTNGNGAEQTAPVPVRLVRGTGDAAR